MASDKLVISVNIDSKLNSILNLLHSASVSANSGDTKSTFNAIKKLELDSGLENIELIIDITQAIYSYAELMKNDLHKKEQSKNRKSKVYFVRKNDGIIKIGFTKNIPERMKSLEASSGSKIELLTTIDGGIKEESMIHDIFKEDRLIGEWFRPSEKLISYIASLAAANDIKQ